MEKIAHPFLRRSGWGEVGRNRCRFFFGWSVQPKGLVHWHQPAFNSMHACVRIDRDTLVNARSAPPPPPRSHFGSSHPRRGWPQFRSHGGSSPSVTFFPNALAPGHVSSSAQCLHFLVCVCLLCSVPPFEPFLGEDSGVRLCAAPQLQIRSRSTLLTG